MKIDEGKYNNLFIEKFKANSVQLEGEFKRVISKYGYSEETKLKFYSEVFQTLIAQFKREVSMDENYNWIISTLYQFFIDTLEEDGIDNSKFKEGLQHFKTQELPKHSILVKDESKHKPVYKNYNLNTKYGRRKAREQAYFNYQNGTPEYRKETDNIRVIVWIVIIGIVILVFLITGKLPKQ
jgi:hypothetical protein